jgi:hypothetical protein
MPASALRADEELWPKKDQATDRKRRRLLQKVERKGVVDRDYYKKTTRLEKQRVSFPQGTLSDFVVPGALKA